MKIKIISLGEKPPKWVVDGFNEYKKRLSKSIPLELIELPIAKRTKTGNPSIWMEQEAKIILSKINNSDHLVILDVKSKIISTEELADKMQNWKFNNPNIVILIGGPDGIHQSIKDLAKEKISISKMTFPHLYCAYYYRRTALQSLYNFGRPSISQIKKNLNKH